MKPIYLVVGCPGSGKTWVCEQLKDKFNHIPHDSYKDNALYVKTAVAIALDSDKPVLLETPFSMSQIVEPLERALIKVTPVVINEHPDVITDRYQLRENRPIPKGHLTRQQTYIGRALDNGWFVGTSAEVLKHLKDV